jgi:hypothetical protein
VLVVVTVFCRSLVTAILTSGLCVLPACARCGGAPAAAVALRNGLSRQR